MDQQEVARRLLCDVYGYSRKSMGCCDVTQCRIFRSGMIHFLSNYCDGLHFLGQTVAVMICCRVDYLDVQSTWITGSGYNFSFCRWWSWTSCIPVKESTGGGIVDIASPQQLPLGIRRLLYWVCQGGNQLMKPKKHFAHQLSRARMWRLVEDYMLQMFLPTRKLHWWQKCTYLWWYWCVISLFSGEVVKEPLHCSCKLWAHCFIIPLPPPN